MICPRCEIGNIKRVAFKASSKKGNVCDYCEMLWYEGDEIKIGTGRPFEVENYRNDLEYILEESEEKDQEHREARFPHVK